MQINEKLLEVRVHEGNGYRPVVDFERWRVAILNHGAATDFAPEKMVKLDRHDETDEIFVLLCGRCLLFIGEGADEVTALHGVVLEPGKVYNVKKGTLHNHILTPGTKVLIVENVDTSSANSTHVPLDDAQRAQIVRMVSENLR